MITDYPLTPTTTCAEPIKKQLVVSKIWSSWSQDSNLKVAWILFDGVMKGC